MEERTTQYQTLEQPTCKKNNLICIVIVALICLAIWISKLVYDTNKIENASKELNLLYEMQVLKWEEVIKDQQNKIDQARKLSQLFDTEYQKYQAILKNKTEIQQVVHAELATQKAQWQSELIKLNQTQEAEIDELRDELAAEDQEQDNKWKQKLQDRSQEWNQTFTNQVNQRENERRQKEKILEQKFQNLTELMEKKLSQYEETWKEKLNSTEEMFEQKINQQENKIQNFQTHINNSIEQWEEAHKIQQQEIRNLVSDNPYFNENKTHYLMKFLSLRHIQATNSSTQNSILELPIEYGLSYTLKFQTFFTDLNPNVRAGISQDNQDWKNQGIRFSQFNSTYGINLRTGRKVVNATQSSIMWTPVTQSGFEFNMHIFTLKNSLGFSNSTNIIEIAFNNIDFKALEFYPIVSISNVNQEVKFLGAEVGEF